MIVRMLASLVIAACFLTTASAEDVIITEIMYNPDSDEGAVSRGEANRVEYVEIYNTGRRRVDMTGWLLMDEDGATGRMPRRTRLDPGEVMVLIPAECGEEEFRKAWGKDVRCVELKNWSSPGLLSLSNKPSKSNEVLQLRDARINLIDQVNYDDEDDWPSDSPDGASIYLKPGKFDAKSNDAGKNWARSEKGTHGAKGNEKTEIFNGEDVGSPGVVVVEEKDGE